MKLIALKLAAYAPSVAVLGAIAFAVLTSLPAGRYPLSVVGLLGTMMFCLGLGMVFCWVGVSKFVNHRFGG